MPAAAYGQMQAGGGRAGAGKGLRTCALAAWQRTRTGCTTGTGGGGQDLGVHVGGSKEAGGGGGCPKAVHVALVVHSRHHPPRQVGLAATPSASANPPACAWERACVRACAWECGSKTAWAGPRAHGSGQGGAGRAHSKDAHTQRHLMAAKQETDLLRAMAWSMAYISRRRPPKKPE